MAALQRSAGNRAVACLVRGRGESVPPVLQLKLVVGAADDPLEREADRMADLVMRAWSSRPVSWTVAEADEPHVRRLTEPRHDLASAFEADATVADSLSARRGSGRPLPPAVRERMELGFGADFSKVRVHRDAEAADLSASLAARAFTHGTDIYFGKGTYNLGSRSGRHLLAHELTHVLQQGQAAPATRGHEDGGSREGLVRRSSAPCIHGRVGEGTVRRDFLDQNEKLEAFRAAVRDYQEEGAVVAAVADAVAQYDASNRGVIDPQRVMEAVVALQREVRRAMGHASAQLSVVLDRLEHEASIVETDLVTAEMVVGALAAGRLTNPKVLGATVRSLRVRLAKYDPKLGASMKAPQQGVYFCLNEALVAAVRRESEIVHQMGPESYNYGDPVTGKIDDEIRRYLADFEAIRAFLADKSSVLRHLLPLAEAVTGPDKLAALKAELGRKEKEAGFSAPKVPLGILPGDVFLGLLRSGTVLDDFGAGLQHGELSHRIQWYAIIDFLQTDGKRVCVHSPLELFKAINSPPFSPNLQGNSMWGTVLDAGTSASATTYSAPGTLNRDLLEASSIFTGEGPGLAERDPAYRGPVTKGLESIGDALVQLRDLRIRQAQELVSEEQLKDKTWTLYGLPPTELVDHIEQELMTGAFKVGAQGAFVGTGEFSSSTPSKRWKVLESTGDV
jgi:hypothetical protein